MPWDCARASKRMRSRVKEPRTKKLAGSLAALPEFRYSENLPSRLHVQRRTRQTTRSSVSR